jgi:hypothetical protein
MYALRVAGAAELMTVTRMYGNGFSALTAVKLHDNDQSTAVHTKQHKPATPR